MVLVSIWFKVKFRFWVRVREYLRVSGCGYI